MVHSTFNAKGAMDDDLDSTIFLLPASVKCKICFNKFPINSEMVGSAKYDEHRVLEAKFNCTLCGAKLSFRTEKNGSNSAFVLGGALIPYDVSKPSIREDTQIDVTSPAVGRKHNNSRSSSHSRSRRADKDLARGDEARAKARKLRQAFGVSSTNVASSTGKPKKRARTKVKLVSGASSLNQGANIPEPVRIRSKRRRMDVK
jgi:hypothetical protein